MRTDELEEQNERVAWRRREKGETARLSFPEKELQEEEAEEEEEEKPCSITEFDGEELGFMQGKRSAPCVQLREGQGKRRCTQPRSLDLGTLLLQRVENTSAQVHTWSLNVCIESHTSRMVHIVPILIASSITLTHSVVPVFALITVPHFVYLTHLNFGNL